MLTNRTVTKKILENIVHETFSHFGLITSSYLLDSLKLLGFHYATNAGISINIEDLKTPNVKKDFINVAKTEISSVSEQWQQGFVSDIERFQTIIDSWNIATESLKNRIVDYYQSFDPANNLYIMAFSGARGNMSQVRQLVGMRGLMSDQEGKIIDLPIQANFREGLSSIDYIISSYGARKGIVDTALKTADSGYLTRRLIYIAQDLVIREEDCQTKEGLIILLKKNSNIKNIIGRSLIQAKTATANFHEVFLRNPILTEKKLYQLKAFSPLTLNVRSALTCKSNGSICQNCYGWDLAHEKMVSLGEAVGIIAAQSIGEPGTQLTMRTFHTGGIFTSETLKQILAPFSGKIIIPKTLKTILYRTNHGVMVLKLQQETKLLIRNWKGLEKEVFLEIGSYLYLNHSCFIKKGQLISEYSPQFAVLGKRKFKPIYTTNAGEIRFENLSVRKIVRGEKKKIKIYKDKKIKTFFSSGSSFPDSEFSNSRKNYQLEWIPPRKIKVNENDGVVWIASGKIFPLPNEVLYHFPKGLKKTKSFASLKLVYPGIVLSTDPFEISNKTSAIYCNSSSITIFNEDIKDSFLYEQNKKDSIFLDFFNLIKDIKNCSIQFSCHVKSGLIQTNTVLGRIYIFPKEEGIIYSIRTKKSENITTYFLITEDDIWKINSDQINNFDFFQEKKTIVRAGSIINSTTTFNRSGFFLKKDGFQMIFQNANPIFLSKGTILNYKQGDFVFEKQVFANLVNYTQQTEDIVQGLPKIEELVEARRPKVKSYLSVRPGIVFLAADVQKEKVNIQRRLINNIFRHRIFPLTEKELKKIAKKVEKAKETEKKKKKKTKKKEEKNTIAIGHSLFLKDELIIYQNRIFRGIPSPQGFVPIVVMKKVLRKNKKTQRKEYVLRPSQNFRFRDENNRVLIFYGRSSLSDWQKDKNRNNQKIFDKTLWKYQNGKVVRWKELTFFEDSIWINKKKDFLIKLTEDNQYLFLEYLNPVLEYQVPLSANILVKPGDFIDIGEPLTEGIIDIHELLLIFFKYHVIIDGISLGTLRSLNKFQLLMVNSIQSIYQSQGVNISSKHIEIIVKQMTSKVIIRDGGDTPLLANELVRLSLMNEILKAFPDGNSEKNAEKSFEREYIIPKFEPLLLSATNSSLSKDGFLSAAGFQETKRVLTKAAIEGCSDWLRGLKECIIIGRLIPAGSSFLNYKNYLDNIYLFKDEY